MKFMWKRDITQLAYDIAEPVLQEVGEILVVDAQDKMGVLFPPASKPGDYPAYRTGHLHESMFTAKSGKGEQIFGNSAEYALLLEEGGENQKGYYIAPRPFLRLTIQNRVKNKIQLKLRKRI